MTLRGFIAYVLALSLLIPAQRVPGGRFISTPPDLSVTFQQTALQQPEEFSQQPLIRNSATWASRHILRIPLVVLGFLAISMSAKDLGPTTLDLKTITHRYLQAQDTSDPVEKLGILRSLRAQWPKDADIARLEDRAQVHNAAILVWNNLFVLEGLLRNREAANDYKEYLWIRYGIHEDGYSLQQTLILSNIYLELRMFPEAIAFLQSELGIARSGSMTDALQPELARAYLAEGDYDHFLKYGRRHPLYKSVEALETDHVKGVAYDPFPGSLCDATHKTNVPLTLYVMPSLRPDVIRSHLPLMLNNPLAEAIGHEDVAGIRKALAPLGPIFDKLSSGAFSIGADPKIYFRSPSSPFRGSEPENAFEWLASPEIRQNEGVTVLLGYGIEFQRLMRRTIGNEKLSQSISGSIQGGRLILIALDDFAAPEHLLMTSDALSRTMTHEILHLLGMQHTMDNVALEQRMTGGQATQSIGPLLYQQITSWEQHGPLDPHWLDAGDGFRDKGMMIQMSPENSRALGWTPTAPISYENVVYPRINLNEITPNRHPLSAVA